MKKFNLFNCLRSILDDYYKFRRHLAYRKLSALGKVVYDYLEDDSLPWVTTGYLVWIENRNFDLDVNKYESKISPDEARSPCILWIKDGAEDLEDRRMHGFSVIDKKILWKMVEQRLDKLHNDKLLKYKDLLSRMTVDKIRGTR